MYEEIYVLDNGTAGIVAVKPGTNELIKLGKYKNQVMFRNKNLLEAELFRSNIKSYELAFILDGNIVPFSKVQQISYDLYQTFIDENVVEIVPTFRDKVFKAGYFSFTEDTETKMSYNEGRELNKVLYSAVKTAAAHLFKEGVFKSSSIDTSLCNSASNIGPMKYEVYNNTTTLRIMRGFELVKINEFRKSLDDKVLPFIGNKDKYKNIYFCFSRDENEHVDMRKYHETANEIIKLMLDYIEKYHMDLNPHINMVNFYYQIQL